MSGGPSESELAEAARALGDALRRAGWRLATAESSTGGLIGHAITMIPGSSDYYPGGVISYSNRAKEVELGVPAALLDAHGAVSEEVAKAMAEGVRERFHTELGIAVTGVAGPDGGTPEKPVGLVFVHAAGPGGDEAVRFELPGERDWVRSRATVAALHLVRRLLTRSRHEAV
jgi:PncC family amidohydrolase